MNPLRIATRGSSLALWQANYLRDALMQQCGVAADIVTMKTSGDRLASTPIENIGVKGVFTKEIEEALLDGRADLAIHSMKDVPTDFSPECRVSIVFRREDPRDALISRSGANLESLAPRSRVGTSSVRRAAQLRKRRPDLEILEIRGNVDSRIRKLDAGEYDAIVLARAGIVRLGMAARITEVLPPQILLPAVGQGALGVEFLKARSDEMKFLSKLEDRETVLAVTAERALMDALHGGCRLPLGAWARFEAGTLHLDACVFSEDGTSEVRAAGRMFCGSENETGAQVEAEADAMGRGVARKMLAGGAGKLLEAAGRTVV